MRGCFTEVREAFWKEEPPLSRGLDLMESLDVAVVPVFLAEGYFTRVVVPRELERGGGRAPPGRRVVVTPPLGTHPALAEVVAARALEALGGRQAASSAAVVVVGHGTLEVEGSDGTARSLAAVLQAAGTFAAVETAFLDQPPGPGEVVEAAAARPGVERVVVVPFLVSGGWHTLDTLPARLAAAGAGGRGPGGARPGLGGGGSPGPDSGGWGSSGPELLVAEPVGTHPRVAELIQEMALRALAALPRLAGTDEATLGGDAAAARAAFRREVDGAGPGGVVLLEVVVARLAGDVYTLRHRDDASLPSGELAPLPGTRPGLLLARHDADGRFRPLRGAPGLRRGWLVRGVSGAAMLDIVEDLYPAALLHRHLEREGRLPVISFGETAARQSGMHAGLGALGEGEVLRLMDELCASGCLRRPVWRPGSEHGGVVELGGGVPCPEPCALFLSRAREALGES